MDLNLFVLTVYKIWDVAVNSASVNAKIAIHKDGLVEGLLEDLKLTKP